MKKTPRRVCGWRKNQVPMDDCHARSFLYNYLTSPLRFSTTITTKFQAATGQRVPRSGREMSSFPILTIRIVPMGISTEYQLISYRIMIKWWVVQSSHGEEKLSRGPGADDRPVRSCWDHNIVGLRARRRGDHPPGRAIRQLYFRIYNSIFDRIPLLEFHGISVEFLNSIELWFSQNIKLFILVLQTYICKRFFKFGLLLAQQLDCSGFNFFRRLAQECR